VILGYSVNDTIVVFDRIREEMNEHPGMTLKEIVNRGINLTMGRTLFTGVTVLSTLCALWFFGGAALSDFSFTLVVGILFGTYSSWFVAAAIAYNLLSKRQKDDPGAARPQKAVTAQARLVTTGAVR
jgi:SecD/SecF fusion protein